MTTTRQPLDEARAAARISAIVGSWPDVEVGAHRFGGVEFCLGRRELGHLHGDSHADIAFPRKVRDELVAAGRAQPHRAIPDSGWISVPIDGEGSIERAVELFRMAYDRARTAKARADSARWPPTPNTRSEEAYMSMHTITPHVVVRDAARAVDWYTNVLGAEERLRIPVPDGRLMSVELRFGDSAVMLADEFPEMGIVSPQTLGGTYMALHLMVDDVDKVWQRALDAGAEVFHPLQDSFWGERHGQVIDPFGHRWGLAQHLRDVSPEELVRAAQEMFATGREDA